MAPGGVEPPASGARLKIPARIVQITLPTRNQTTRKGVTMSTIREAWLSVVQDGDGREETELVTIDRDADGVHL